MIFKTIRHYPFFVLSVVLGFSALAGCGGQVQEPTPESEATEINESNLSPQLQAYLDENNFEAWMVGIGDAPEGETLPVMSVSKLSNQSCSCGDVTGDGGVSLTDLTALVNHLFEGNVLLTGDYLECADVDGREGLNLSDLTYLVNFLFIGGEPPCANEGKDFSLTQRNCVEPEKGIFLLPNQVLFDKTVVNQAKIQTIELGNFGNVPVSLTGYSIEATRDGSAATDSPFDVLFLTPQILNPPLESSVVPGNTTITGPRVNFSVTFNPEQAGTYEGIINLKFADGIPNRQIHLAGASVANVPDFDVTSCGILDVDNANYTVTGPLASSESCLTITGDNITLNVNNQTIQYGSGGERAQYGIEVNSSNVLIENGTVVQSPDAGEDSHGIYLHFAAENSTVRNMDISVSSHDSINISAPYHEGLLHIYGNDLDNNVVSITSRHQYDGRVIANWPTASENSFSKSSIHDNTITEGAQAGIVIADADSQVFRNTIKQNSYFVNDYAIEIRSQYGGVEVFENIIEPTSGRGIHVNWAGHNVHNNKITAMEVDRGWEYSLGGDISENCALGTKGIELERTSNGTNDILIYANDVKAIANDCYRAALRITDIQRNSNTAVCRNSFSAERIDGSEKMANALDVSGADADAGFLIKNNSFIADTHLINFRPYSTSGLVLNRNNFSIGENPADNFSAINGERAYSDVIVNDIFILDSEFTNGANPRDVSWHERASGSFDLMWMLEVEVVDSNGNPLAGAEVRATDAAGNPADVPFFSNPDPFFVTDENGIAKLPLREFVWHKEYGTTFSTFEELASHVVRARKGSDDPDVYYDEPVAMNASKQIQIVIPVPQTDVPTSTDGTNQTAK